MADQEKPDLTKLTAAEYLLFTSPVYDSPTEHPCLLVQIFFVTREDLRTGTWMPVAHGPRTLLRVALVL